MAIDTIAEFDLDINQLLTKAKEAKTALNGLTDELKTLKKSGDTSSETFVKTESALKKARSEYGAYSKALQTNLDNTGKLTNVNTKLNKSLDAEVRSIEGARKSNKELIAIRNKLDVTSKEGIKAGDKINQKLNENNKFIKENVSAYEEQKIGIGGYEEAIKNALSGTDLFGVNITQITDNFKQYTESVVNVSKQILGMSKTQDDSAKATTKGAVAQDAMTTATSKGSKALKFLKIALVSTGIGAIVVIIGMLVAAFLSTQKGVDAVNKVLAPLKGAISGIIGVVQKIATSLNVFDRVKDAFIKLKNEFLLGVNYMRLAWAKVFGTNDEVSKVQSEIKNNVDEINKAIERGNKRSKEFSDSYKNAGKEIRSAVEAQKNIEKLTIDISNAENDLILTKAKLIDQIKEQEAIAKNTTLSSLERNKAVEEAKRLSDELAGSETNILNLKIQQKQLQNSQNDTSREEIKELNSLIAQRTTKETESRARDLKFLGTKNSLVKEQKAKRVKASQERKKAQEDAIAHQKRLLDLFVLRNDKENSSFAEKIKLADTVYKKELALIEQKKKAGLSVTEAEIEQENARLKLLETKASLTIDNANKELGLYILNNEFKFNNDVKLNANLLSEQKTFLQEKQRLQLEALENENLSVAEYEAKKAEIKRNTTTQINAQEKALQKQNTQDKKDQESVSDQLEIQSLIDKDALVFEIKEVKLLQDFERDQLKIETEVTNAEIKKQRLELLEKQYATASTKITQEKEKAKLNEASNTLGGVSELLGKETIAGKSAGIAQATINTYQGVTQVWRSPTTIPEPFGTIAKVANTAVVLASGLKSVQAIKNTKAPKAEHGGVGNMSTLKGGRHSQGGIGLYDAVGQKVVEAEDGENVYAITNREASSKINELGLLGTLSYINQNIGGGVALDHNVSYANDGGLVNSRVRGNTQNVSVVDNQAPTQKIQVINVVDDTLNMYNESVRVENEASF